ncbi:Small RNA 2'-O-methyltransferase [Apostasia shenzhenica]|uniref:Small RNA 2'-O-methyltransferase n=1 Tax=Apostasia shenzhenica TaxID=1088818 RepID=A0A2I0ADE8_9ASPA|nr:Small RNA 2'-O-methyltransferase [Apostasia shenzhenica]
MMRPALAPKALIHQKFGSQAQYRIEEVLQHAENSCPGLAIAQQPRSLYKCYLDLPELSVSSDPFPRKKDAEHAASKIAMEMLGIESKVNNPTPQEALDELILRISYFFADEFLSSNHPLAGHFKVAFKRIGGRFGMIPLPVVTACDAKVSNLCKAINPKAESDPVLALSILLKAVRMSASICISDVGFWIWKLGTHSAAIPSLVEKLDSASVENIHVEAVLFPLLPERDVESLTLCFSDSQYYMDEIAQKLNVKDSSCILISRIIGKASSEMRLYFSAPKLLSCSSDSLDNFFSSKESNINLEKMLNRRASYLSGQNIYGDAIMVQVGYTWKSSDLFCDDVFLSSYYRLLLGKLPNGHYKLLREAMLGAELPTAYTTRSNWKGPAPKTLLSVFCRQHRLSEPIFSTRTFDCTETSAEICYVSKKSKLLSLVDEDENVNGELEKSISAFRCEVKICSKKGDPIIECSCDDTYRKECDAIQGTALKVLSWLTRYFEQLDMPVKNLLEFGLAYNISVYPQAFLNEFAIGLSSYDFQKEKRCTLSPISMNLSNSKYENGMIHCNIDGPDSGVYPSPGSVICISYAVVLLHKDDDTVNEILESKDEFEFEMGTGAVINELEFCMNQLTVNQSAQFHVDLPFKHLILAAAGEPTKRISQLSLDDCFLEYSVKLLQVTEPLEERIEQALFSPPLSKQRVEFAVKRINESHASSLVDFGCGSGSLLNLLLDHTTTLGTIAGVDISRRSLIRAAKVLHSKLSTNTKGQDIISCAALYDGSITKFDSRLFGFDIGTCLEVIEHMEEDEACLFGEIVLSLFRPKVLIVSTPNYEYNPILQRSSFPSQDNSEDKATPSKFRNHDHKFEWTRQQFQQWANSLAAKHHYIVEFSGVGGSGDSEPGFASQIAVFRRNSIPSEKLRMSNQETSQPYEMIWEWSSQSPFLSESN